MRPSLRSRRDLEAPVKVWEDLPEVREGLGGPFGGPVGVGRPSRRTRRSLEDLKVREGSGGPPASLVWVGSPSRRFGWGGEAFPKIREAVPEFQKALLEVYEALPKVREGSVGPTKGPRWVGKPYQRSGWG